MNDINERVENIEDFLDELALDIHASKVAITILSTVINGMSKEPGHLARSFEEARKIAPPLEFEHPVKDGYEEKLNEKILALLSKVS